MASTYSTNFGIEKIGSGEQSGTWGTTTNHNLDIVDRIGAFKSVALSDASTATLTVRAGSPSSGSSNNAQLLCRLLLPHLIFIFKTLPQVVFLLL